MPPSRSNSGSDARPLPPRPGAMPEGGGGESSPKPKGSEWACFGGGDGVPREGGAESKPKGSSGGGGGADTGGVYEEDPGGGIDDTGGA